jgi:outer membrane lipoprotein-sorting protein
MVTAMTRRRRRRLVAWSVPAALVIGVAAVGMAPKLMPASADPVPNLPTLTPAELLVKAATANVQTFSGHVTLDANLGLPDLGSLGAAVGTGTAFDFLSGSHTASVAVDGPDHVRVALPSIGAENDWIRSGNDLWAWNSRNQSVTHVTIPADVAGKADTAATTAPPTPDQLAQQLLAAVDPSTAVSVETPGYVAGRPVYELVLTPRSADSTVQNASIAVDAATGMALDAKITAKGATSPALELGFNDISFDQPAASTFQFTPPPGATVTQASTPSAILGLGGDGPILHEGRRVGRKVVPSNGTEAAPAPTPAPPAVDSHLPSGTTVVGTAWDSVVITKSVPLNGPIGGILSDAQTVTTPAGTGRLITTSLVNVIVLPDGRVAAGAVTPQALAAAIPAS